MGGLRVAARSADDILGAAKATPNRINSARVLIRSAKERGPYHNFPSSLDDLIFKGK